MYREQNIFMNFVYKFVEDQPFQKRGPGRPRLVSPKPEPDLPKRKPGRPKKEELLPEPPKTGRPPKYTKELSDTICRRMANGEPLTRICREKDMPDYTTVMSWLWKDSPYRDPFAKKYELARKHQAEFWADIIVEISDDDSGDFIEKVNLKSGQTYMALDPENIQRSRLRIEARKWVCSKMWPKKYGDSQSVKHEGSDGGPVTFRVIYESQKQIVDEGDIVEIEG